MKEDRAGRSSPELGNERSILLLFVFPVMKCLSLFGLYWMSWYLWLDME